jgi:prefoldin subunit 5
MLLALLKMMSGFVNLVAQVIDAVLLDLGQGAVMLSLETAIRILTHRSDQVVDCLDDLLMC